MSAPPGTAQAAAVEVGTRIRGHVTGLRQYVRSLRLTLRPPASYDVDAAARTLADTFLIEMEGEPAPDDLARPGLTVPAAGLLATTCALARHLLQTSGLPLFERERLVALAPHPDLPGATRVDLLVPTLEHTPRALYAEAYGRALEIAEAFARPPDARDGLAAWRRRPRRILGARCAGATRRQPCAPPPRRPRQPPRRAGWRVVAMPSRSTAVIGWSGAPSPCRARSAGSASCGVAPSGSDSAQSMKIDRHSAAVMPSIR
jgi:hypothetical protein